MSSLRLARFSRCSAQLLLMLHTIACSDETAQPSDDDLPAHVSVQIGEKGGTLKASGGLTLEIPEGALDKNIKISATNVGQTAPKEIQAKQVSDLYEFGPEGTKFMKDVKIVFHTEKEEKRAEVYFTKEDGSGFEKIASQKNGTVVTAFVKHFSQGFVGVPLDDMLDAGAGEALDASEDVDAGDAQQPGEGMDAGTTAALDADLAPARDASDPGALQDAGTSSTADASADAAVVPTNHIVVHSRDLYGTPVNQTWAAFQDGQGAWQALAPTSKPGVYEFDVASASFGVAFVCSTVDLVNSWGTLAFEPASTAVLDVTTRGVPCTLGTPPAMVNLQGTLTLAPDVNWRMGHSELTTAINYSGAPADFSTNLRQNIATDLLFAAGPLSPALTINRVLVQRDVMISANTTGYNSSMDGGVPPGAAAQAQVLNASANTTVDVHYTTRGSVDGLWLNTADTSGTTTRAATFATMPDPIRRTTDRYLLLGADESASGWRKASLSAYPSGNLSVALPPAFVTTFSALATPYLRPTFGFTPVGGANLYAFSIVYSPVRTSSHSFDIEVDPAWLSASTSQTLTFPDLSQVAGFQSAWVAPAASTVSAKAAVSVTKSDATGDLKSESGQSATVTAP